MRKPRPPLRTQLEQDNVMSDFTTFYFQGGVFMHFITLFTLAATTLLISRVAKLRDVTKRANDERTVVARSDSTGGILIAIVMLGALGTVFGFIEIAAAVQTVPEAQWAAATVRALPIALSTIAWSLMCATPLVLVRAVVRSAEARVRALTPST